MNHFIGSVSLPNDSPKTIQELIQAAISARTYPGAAGAQQKYDAASRITNLVAEEGFMIPAGDVYMIDAYKGNLNGVAVAASWVGADFTGVPGGGIVISGGISRHFNHGAALGSRVLYQNSGADMAIELDVIFR